MRLSFCFRTWFQHCSFLSRTTLQHYHYRRSRHTARCMCTRLSRTESYLGEGGSTSHSQQRIQVTSRFLCECRRANIFLFLVLRTSRVEFEGPKTTLYIRGAKMTDAGWYQCTATSPAGTAITKCKVTVIRKCSSLWHYSMLKQSSLVL